MDMAKEKENQEIIGLLNRQKAVSNPNVSHVRKALVYVVVVYQIDNSAGTKVVYYSLNIRFHNHQILRTLEASLPLLWPQNSTLALRSLEEFPASPLLYHHVGAIVPIHEMLMQICCAAMKHELLRT